MRQDGAPGGQREMRFQMQPGQRPPADGQRREFRMESRQGQESGARREVRISPDRIKPPDKNQSEDGKGVYQMKREGAGQNDVKKEGSPDVKKQINKAKTGKGNNK